MLPFLNYLNYLNISIDLLELSLHRQGPNHGDFKAVP